MMSPSVFKRSLFTLLSLFLITALAGCSSSDSAGTSDNTTGGTLSSPSEGASTDTDAVKTVLNEVNLSANEGEELNYSIEVPEGTSNLNVLITNVTGDPDLYVRHGSEPTQNDYDCRPYVDGEKDESCDFDNPQTGTWHVMVHAYKDFSGVSLKGGSGTAVASGGGFVDTMGMPTTGSNPGSGQGNNSDTTNTGGDNNNSDGSSNDSSGNNTGDSSNDNNNNSSGDNSGDSSNGNTGGSDGNSGGNNTGGDVGSSGGGSGSDTDTNTNTTGLNQLVFSDLRRTMVNETITFPVLGND
ncbi:MAG TPA: hypothetical protein EYH06_03810, partial [Chromatiales bacterium]|nr:hypothetical protein [Chromatiales bacterium]